MAALKAVRVFFIELIGFTFKINNSLNGIAVINGIAARIHDQEAVKHFKNVG